MIVRAILFIVLPLAGAWIAGASAYFPPYPARKTEPEIEPAFEAEVRMFLARHSEPDAADRRMAPGVRGNALMDGAASGLAANDLPRPGHGLPEYQSAVVRSCYSLGGRDQSLP
jgi:hypothetical protein